MKIRPLHDRVVIRREEQKQPLRVVLFCPVLLLKNPHKVLF